MKKYISLLLIALMFCAVISAGCGGEGSDDNYADPEQTESLNENTGGEDTGDYDPNEESRGTSGTVVTDLSTLTAAHTAQDGETLTGKIRRQVKISIADGATVTLSNATIEGKNWASTPWAGLTCQGDATLILEGNNYVQNAHTDYPAIYVPESHTLTIKGIGKLTADADDSMSASIGGGHNLPCGNIVIESGNIVAKGGKWSACIGGGFHSNCGNITIKDTFINIIATKGYKAPYSIGAAHYGDCGTVTIGGEVGQIEKSPYIYGILTMLKEDYTVPDSGTLAGELKEDIKISIADGATVTLHDATINGKNWASTKWAGLTCEGDATLILEGTNSVQNAHQDFPAIYVPVGHTLTIKGSGKLTADASWSHSAGIGGGNRLSCGNIVIEEGTIEAIGGHEAGGIGGGYYGNCGDITIKDSVTKVTATKGRYAVNSIGAGNYASCGTVTIGVDVGEIEKSPYDYAGTIYLSKVTSNRSAQDGITITGQLNADVKISVADGATVTLKDVTINGKNWDSTRWAGLTCEGDATLIIEGNNYVQNAYTDYPAIYVPESHTLTIKGIGKLTADADDSMSASIGGGHNLPCGNIVIESGNIVAKGGKWSACIGGGFHSNCGNITIKDTFINIIATKGYKAPYSIGAAHYGDCGTVTIGGEVGQIEKSPYIYGILTMLKEDYTVPDSGTLAGELKEDIKISIADGATVTLHDATINGKNWASTKWAGLTCEGDATLILEGTNSVQNAHQDFPAIYVPVGHTLTIKGSGKLTADASWSHSAGIGGGNRLSCGNIVIEEGTIEAIGGHEAGGIGGGYYGNCGDITIKDSVTKVTATKGRYAVNSIGAGNYASCGTVTIGVDVGEIEKSPYDYAGTIYLSKVTSNRSAQDGITITGQLNADVKISVADGATVTLKDVTINGKNWDSTRWAGLTCEGDATLIIEGNNFVQNAYYNYPAIYVPQGKTLTIKGSGNLTAYAKWSYSAGIGGGRETSCGNIVIEGGTITAIGSQYGAAGIGGGYESSCGDITIKNTVTRVTATRGTNAKHSIGAGRWGSCGTVTIGKNVGSRSETTYTYEGTIDLSRVTSDYTAKDEVILTGKLGEPHKISVADGATIILRNITIETKDWADSPWAGLTCEGDATFILEGDNYVQAFHQDYPAVYVPGGKTLTIRGNGKLTVVSNSAGISSGNSKSRVNIVIEGGRIIQEIGGN